MFVERLNRISDRIEGALALSLVARDGIPVESVRPAGGGGERLDLDALAAELLTQVKAISENHSDLSVGRVRQFAITTDRYTIMVTAVTDDYYLLLVMGERGNYGRARFELVRARLLFAEDLE